MLQTHSHDLDAGALTELVDGLAGRPDLWRHLVTHRADARTYEQLHRDDHVAVWLICWMNDHDTGFHDHDLSAGALSVVRGSVCYERLVLDGAPSSRTISAGGTLTFAASDIHRVAHTGSEPAVTLHAYSPPLWRMGAYEVSPEGTLRRHSMSYAEELRPLDEGAIAA